MGVTQNLKGDEAIKLVRAKRPGSVETTGQANLVIKYLDSYVQPEKKELSKEEAPTQ